jgi:hypothetical protein
MWFAWLLEFSDLSAGESDGVLLDDDGFPGALVLQLLWTEGLSLLL